MMWASDFSHFDVMVPSITEKLHKSVKGVADGLQRKILGDNALEAYGCHPRQ